jgi:hypothetical protein
MRLIHDDDKAKLETAQAELSAVDRHSYQRLCPEAKRSLNKAFCLLSEVLKSIDELGRENPAT